MSPLKEQITSAAQTLTDAQHIVVIQAENPDGDSLASALALEHFFGNQGKKVTLYCPVQMPRHLRFITGWDRVAEDLPNQFDVSVIVDTSASLLLERVFAPQQLPRLRARPTIVIDHHATEADLPYQTETVLAPTAAATGEVIFEMSQQLDWKITPEIAKLLCMSILFDTLGLSTESTSARTIRIIADLVEKGANLAEIDADRRKQNKKSIELVRYKARLMERIDYSLDGRLAEIIIPWEEIQTYSDQYNPSMLVIDEMRMTEHVCLAIAYKTYPDGKITAKIRANYGYPIAGLLAESFDGGGHAYAAGFKLRKHHLDSLRQKIAQRAIELLGENQSNA